MSKRLIKENLIQDIRDKFSANGILILYNYSKTQSEDIFQLKRKLKKVNADWKIYKNTLLFRSLKNMLPNDDLTKTKEQNAVIFCKEENDDYLNVLKILNKFSPFDFQHRLKHAYIINGGIVKNDKLLEWSRLDNRSNIVKMLISILQINILKMIKALIQIKKD